MKSHVTLAIGALLLLGGCHSSPSNEGPDDPRRRILRSWGTNVLVPTYQELEERTATLDANARALCTEPSPDALREAQQSWSDARAPLKRMEVFDFGPSKDEPLRLGPRIDFWPVRPGTIETVLTGTDPIDAPALGAPAVGFPAIEYVIHGPGSEAADAFEPSSRRCSYLVALTADLALRATDLRSAWDPAEGNYIGELVDAGESSQTFSMLNAAFGEVVNRMWHTVENMRRDKLGKPVGTESGGSPQADKAESQYSGRSLEDLRDNLRGIEQLFFTPEGDQPIGLDVYLRELDRDFDGPFRMELDAAHGAIDAIDDPLTSTIESNPTSVTDAIEQLGALQRLIQVDIINSLALSTSFNDNDGD